MKANIDRTFCIGCGVCVKTCPNVFRFELPTQGKAEVYADVNDADKAKVEGAKKACPTGAIIIE